MTDNYEIFGKVPPQATEIEAFVLGAMMLEKEAVDMAVATISHEVFYKDIHQTIFKAIKALSKKNEPVDILTVTMYLREPGTNSTTLVERYISRLLPTLLAGTLTWNTI